MAQRTPRPGDCQRTPANDDRSLGLAARLVGGPDGRQPAPGRPRAPLDQIEDLLPLSAAYRQAGRILFADQPSGSPRPLTPLHGGHTALLAVSSMLDGIFGSGNERHLSAWHSVKVVEKKEEEEDGVITITERERFSNELTLIFENGNVATLK
jgi:hypothetical protein